MSVCVLSPHQKTLVQVRDQHRVEIASGLSLRQTHSNWCNQSKERNLRWKHEYPSREEETKRKKVTIQARKARDKRSNGDKQVIFKSKKVKTLEHVFHLRNKKRFTGETWLFMLFGLFFLFLTQASTLRILFLFLTIAYYRQHKRDLGK